MDEVIQSIISAALAGDSVEVKTNVEKAIGDRVAAQLEMKKIDIARDLIGQQPNMSLMQTEGKVKKPKDDDMKKENFEALLKYVREELEIDVEDIEELEMILEDMTQDDLSLLMEDFQESLSAVR